MHNYPAYHPAEPITLNVNIEKVNENRVFARNLFT